MLSPLVEHALLICAAYKKLIWLTVLHFYPTNLQVLSMEATLLCLDASNIIWDLINTMPVLSGHSKIDLACKVRRV